MPKSALPMGAKMSARREIAPVLISIDDVTKKGKREGNTAFMHRFMPFTQDFDVSSGKRSSPIPKKTMPARVKNDSNFSYFKLITSMIYMC